MTFDTGSDWIAVSSDKCANCDFSKIYDTSGKMPIGQEFPLDYGSCSFNGTSYQDKVCLADTCLDSFLFYAINSQTGIDDTDGILGLAPNEDQVQSILV